MSGSISRFEGAVRAVVRGSQASAALTAAGSPVIVPTAGTRPESAPEAIKARTQGWQKRILEFAKTVPEVAGAASLVENSVSRVIFSVEGGSAALRARVQAKLDALDIERLAKLIWLSGEGYVAWPTADDEDPYTLSICELNTHADPITRVQANGAAERMPDPFMRIWRPSLTNRWHASSPNEAAMDLVESMYLHQLADTAIATSRLAGAGLLFWPTNAPSIPLTPDGRPAPGSREALLAEFTEASMQAISQRDSREATIPFVVFYDPQGEDYKPELLRIDRDDHAEQYKARFETYRQRYATAIDLPVETTTGMGSTNHWSAWQIDVDKWKTYLAPLVELIRVQLEQRLVKTYGEKLTIVADATALLAKPDQTDTIMKLATLGLVEPESVQKALLSGDLADLVMREAPETEYTSNVAPGQPSDFGTGDTDRGGGKFRDRP